MTYTNEVLAKKDAKEFLDAKVEDGCWVRLRVEDGVFKVLYGPMWAGPVNRMVFEFIPQPKLDRDQGIWVRYEDGPWWRRHATGDFNEDGWVGCYERGCTSFTESIVKYWPVYSLTDPNERLVDEEHMYKI